jgi:hypothetical protein
MQVALRGSVHTAPCKLMPGSYTFQWRAAIDHAGTAHSQLEVSVWEHPANRAPRLLSMRVVHAEQDWVVFDEPFGVIRGMPVSLKIRWLDGPGYPEIVDGQPQIALTLDPKVYLVSAP